MPNNNPSGVNSFDKFAPEQPYGEVTQQKKLAGGAPLAGAPIASGPIGAPRQAQRQSQRPVSTGKPQAAVAPPSMEPSYQASLAHQWATIAAIPGASPLVQQYAAQAAQALGG